MKLIKFLTLLAIIFSTTACETMVKQTFSPRPFGLYAGMEGNSPDGTPFFKSGWKAGCESGMAAYGNLHHKATHDFQYDPAYLNNNEYHAAWRVGFRHCRWYTAQWDRD